MGVTSEIFVILKPQPFKALTADSRPAPGPETSITKLIIPKFLAASPALEAATWAAKGVLFLEPLNPDPPALAQVNVFPCLSVILIMAVSYTHLTLPTIYSV